jgi:7-cyano-7-deazaguanine reductase
MSKLDNTNVSKHLGQVSTYAKEYDPSLLVREPRQSNRTHLNLDNHRLPFIGVDVWNGYEVSALLNNGMPVNAVARVAYSASNPYIVESKSMKLYWNSFNMTRIGANYTEVLSEIANRATTDLSKLLETNVKVSLHSPADPAAQMQPYFCNYTNLDKTVGENCVCDCYTENSSLLKVYKSDKVVTLNYHSSALKSNCRVTAQPDFGDVFIHYRGNYEISMYDALRYIVSFRDECHFHEEICETIYDRFYKLFDPTELMVACLYTRRGGWDINPVRATHWHLIPQLFDCVNVPVVKTNRQ